MMKLALVVVLAATLPTSGCAPAAAVALGAGIAGTIGGIRMMPDEPCGSTGCIGTTVLGSLLVVASVGVALVGGGFLIYDEVHTFKSDDPRAMSRPRS